MADLSPAARAVWEAFNSKFDWVEDGVPGPQFQSIAAALRAAVVHLPISAMYPSSDWGHGWRTGIKDAERKLLSIATELDGAND